MTPPPSPLRPQRPDVPTRAPHPPSPNAEATFLSALDRAPAERDTFVAGACAGNDELAAEVRQMLALHHQAGDFLKEAPLSPEIEEELARLKPEEGGDVIGPYKLREQIGEGGFGTVWVADQETPVRRRVALKIIKMGMDTKEVVARFEQERQALAMMDHPNIAKVLDAGATQYGRPFFVMELVRGVRITDYCDGKQLSTAERIELFIFVCQAVQHAHQKGIVHRDLKPSNILVTINDGKAVPKVIDFGVAKATQGRLTDQTVYTQFQQMIGTPIYMSPEQAELTSLDIDTRSDIFSLGVLLYELLTGRTPIDTTTMAAAGLDEIRRLIREVEPPRPSMRMKTFDGAEMTTAAKRRSTEPAKLWGALRGDLDWIVMKCLEKDRQRRYDTANGLALDLQRHLRNEVVIARPPTAGYLLGKLVRRHKVVFTAGVAIAAALLIAVVGTTYGLFRAKRAAAAERLAKQDADVKRAEAVKQQHRAEENEKKTAEAEREATEQATVAGLLANYVNAKYMLSQGRIEPAYKAIGAAIRVRPHWEYGHLLSEIVATGRKDWLPVARFAEVTDPTPASAFVGPAGEILATVSGARLRLFDVSASRIRAETTLTATPAVPFRIGEREVGVADAHGVRIFSIDNLAINRSLPLTGEVKLAEADSAGKLLVVLSTNGDTTLFETATMKPLANHHFNIVVPGPGSPALPALGFSPSGKLLLFTPGLWPRPDAIWDWAEDKEEERIFRYCITAKFLDDRTVVVAQRSDSTAENLGFEIADLATPKAPPFEAAFASRANGHTLFTWPAGDANGKPTVLAACTSADSIDIFALREKAMLSSTRFATLLPTCPVDPRFLAFYPESGLLAVAGDKDVTVFQSAGYRSTRAAAGPSAPMDYWCLAAANDSMFTAARAMDNAKQAYLQLSQRSFLDDTLLQIPCQWPKAGDNHSADVWGLAVTPDAKTAAVLWQEDSDGSIDGEFYRKAILIYQLDSPPDDRGRLIPKRTIWLEKYLGSNGRTNRWLCLSPDGQNVTVFPASGDATIYRVEDGTVVAEVQVGQTICISPDGSLFAGGFYMENQPVRVWRSASGTPVFATPESGEVTTMAFTQDNQMLYVGWKTGILESFDLASGKSVAKIPTKLSPLAISPRGDRFIAFLPDNNKLGNVSGSAVLGSLADGQTVLVLTEGAHILNRAFFSHSGGGIAFMKARGSARLARSLTLEQAVQQFEMFTPFGAPTK